LDAVSIDQPRRDRGPDGHNPMVARKESQRPSLTRTLHI
jgi:hypothetical protein